jgi:hypothetical protein
MTLIKSFSAWNRGPANVSSSEQHGLTLTPERETRISVQVTLQIDMPNTLPHQLGVQGLKQKANLPQHSGSQRSGPDKLSKNGRVLDCCNCRLPDMYRKQHNGQLSREEFPFPIGDTLEPENRWVLLSASAFMPWEAKPERLHRLTALHQ